MSRPFVPPTDELTPLLPIWHMQVAAQCMTLAACCHLVPWGTKDMGRLPGNVIEAAQKLVHDLADECAKAELRRGLRARREILQDANARLWALLKAFRPTNWRDHPSAPGAEPIAPESVVPRGSSESPEDEHVV